MANKETKTNKKENNKNKRSFLKDFKAELKKVVWPTPKQLLNNTVAVVTIVLITAVIVFVLDLAFEAVNKHGIDKVKGLIDSSNTVSENATNETEESEENVTSTEGETVPEETVEENNTTEENVQENTENSAE